MNAEEVRKLGEAIAHNAELLSELDSWEDEPIELFEVSQSFGLLKNARFIEQIDDNLYLPGENFELLRKAINTSNYELNTIPDIACWLSDFKHLASQYELSQDESMEEGYQQKMAMNRKLHQLTSNLKSSIREIDHNASAEFGYCKTLEAKIKENNFYHSRTNEILDKLERLNYKEFLSVSNHPDIEQLTLNRAYPKVEELRSYLHIVLGKLQRLGVSFMETEARTRKLRRILTALNEKRINTPGLVETLDYESVEALNSISPSSVGKPLAGYGLEASSSFNRSRFEDIARKIKFTSVGPVPVIKHEDAYLIQEQQAEDDVESFEAALAECKNVFSRFITSRSERVSIVEYWSNTTAINTLISADAWLFEMNTWLHEVQQGLKTENSSIQLETIEREVHYLSDVYIVSDILVSYSKAA